MAATYVLRERLDDVLTTALQIVVLVVRGHGDRACLPTSRAALAATTALLIIAAAPAVVLGKRAA